MSTHHFLNWSVFQPIHAILVSWDHAIDVYSDQKAGKKQMGNPYCILSSIVHAFFIENDAEILRLHYTWKVAFGNFIHKQSIQVKL